MVLKAVLSVFLSITRRTMFFQLWVFLLRRRKSSCLDDSQSQLLSSVVNLLLGHQSHIFVHERRLVFIVGQGFISVLLAKNKYCYWSWFFTLCLEPSFLLFWGKWFSGLSERLSVLSLTSLQFLYLSSFRGIFMFANVDLWITQE